MRMMRPHGFTLIELTVVMALVGVLVASIYQFFARTSDALYEAESLAETTDRGRFALELIARDIQSAGSFGTPDSGAIGGGVNVDDIWINRTQATQQNYRVRSIIQATNTQDRYLVAQSATGANTNNPGVGMDDVILIGAYDFPFTFEATNVQMSASGSVTLANNARGYLRFGRQDPFNLNDVTTLPSSRADSLRAVQRIVRLMDHNGYIQFSRMGAVQPTPNAGTQVLSLAGPLFMARQGNDLWGLEPAATEDVGYDAALLDVFRYRVCRDATDATNLRLVKERLIPDQPIMGASVTMALPPAQCGVAQPGVVVPGSQVSVVDRVVDFQIWYDCVPANGGVVIPWVNRWDTTVATVDSQLGHDCMLAVASGAETPGRGRMAHVRLSVRTEDERRDVPNYGFVDLATGAQSLTPTATTGSLQTYDIDGDPATSARVMTFQVDVELPNFGARSATAATAAAMP
jgi:prepilin-type N-terminal cleavage/methylation domain-containing protein